ncbi:hypothetical protein PoB_004129900 [Plakobranchus ocellatus]|uniref:Uncharacterized protein n=1 Tax=Plakobranchus ocellatus TaxID=259542 RepID=A0AAV4B3Z5_9GAST|nr:hypothetical protein PoB_004129900 [Plakobranchus ocellatus]
MNDDPPYFSIETAVSKVNNFAILILGSCTPAFSSAIVKEDDIYYIFDPHSRDSAGMASPDGTTLRISHVSVAKSDSDDLPLVEIQRKSYVRRKTRRKALATSWASSSDQCDWNSDKDPDYVPQDDQPSDDDWMPTEKMRTPRKSTQSQPIAPLK